MISLNRFWGNPIISPTHEHSWESKAIFNPGAVYENGRVHIVYRAMSEDNTSVLGYASSRDGFHMDERLDEPIYVPREEFEKKAQQGNSGCEDPRITRIDDRFYMCYTAYDGGRNPPRVALTSIKVSDFLNKNWEWKKPVLISPPRVEDKDACIFPERTEDGEYIIFHRIRSTISLDIVNNLDFDGTNWTGITKTIPYRPGGYWDSAKIGIGGPPIKTKEGWLLIYHGISDYDREYRLGAMLLDLDNPSIIISRPFRPILEPRERYEREGHVPNVVFTCGSVVMKNTLFVYYGCADKVIGVATADLDEFLGEITKTVMKFNLKTPAAIKK